METETKTGWIVYYICDRSGAGRKTPNYIYLGMGDTDDRTVRDYILYNYENWALDAESYHLNFDKNIVPPKEIVEAKIKELTDRYNELKATAHALTSSLVL